MTRTNQVFLGIFLITFFPSICFSKGVLKVLNEETWSEILREEWMVEFYAPWCPACQQLQPVWKDFAQWGEDLNVKVASIDVTTSPGLSGRFMITALPTIFHVKDGVFRQYRGARDMDSFLTFVDEKKWKAIDPVSSWKSPQSYQMSTVSYFFKLATFVRNLHTSLVQDYGIPYWGSYIIFGLSTILIGAFLGLCVVIAIDLVYPKTSYRADPQNPEATEQNEPGDGEDSEAEDAEDNELRKRRN